MEKDQIKVLKDTRKYVVEKAGRFVEGGTYLDDDGSIVVDWFDDEFEKCEAVRITTDGRMFEIRPRSERELKSYKTRMAFLDRAAALV